MSNTSNNWIVWLDRSVPFPPVNTHETIINDSGAAFVRKRAVPLHVERMIVDKKLRDSRPKRESPMDRLKRITSIEEAKAIAQESLGCASIPDDEQQWRNEADYREGWRFLNDVSGTPSEATHEFKIRSSDGRYLCKPKAAPPPRRSAEAKATALEVRRDHHVDRRGNEHSVHGPDGLRIFAGRGSAAGHRANIIAAALNGELADVEFWLRLSRGDE